jgi:RNA polymerase sigma-70 factor (ECF subfamily)
MSRAELKFSAVPPTTVVFVKPQSEEPLDDSQILDRLSTHGAKELSELFTRMNDSLCRMVANRIHPRLQQRIDPADIIQETYIRAMKSLDRFLESPKVHPVIWLRLLAKNVAIEIQRKQFRDIRSPNREIVINDSQYDFFAEQLADSMPSMLSKVSAQEMSQKVECLITSLSENDQEILEMRHKDQMSLVDIATALSISTESAKKRYQRAFARFREVTKSLVDSQSHIRQAPR